MLQSAVIEAMQVTLGYVDRQRKSTERVVHPLGLATKGQTWYLVADTAAGLRTFRIDRVTSVTRTGAKAVRPPGFVLTEAWKLIAEEVDQRRNSLWAHGTVDPSALWLLRRMFGTRLRIGSTNEFGWIEVELGSNHARALAGEIGGLGSLVQLDGPPDVLSELVRIGRQLIALYEVPE